MEVRSTLATFLQQNLLLELLATFLQHNLLLELLDGVIVIPMSTFFDADSLESLLTEALVVNPGSNEVDSQVINKTILQL